MDWANKADVKEYNRLYHEKHKEESKAKYKIYRAKNLDKLKEKDKKWSDKNKKRKYLYNRDYTERNKDRVRASYNKRTKELFSSYIAGLMAAGTCLKAKDIPQSLIQAKRAELKLKRLIKD